MEKSRVELEDFLSENEKGMREVMQELKSIVVLINETTKNQNKEKLDLGQKKIKLKV